MSRKVTTEDFILRSIQVHGNKYSYNKTQYIKMWEKVTITCQKHGDFQQHPADHLYNHGCSKCKADSASFTWQEIYESFPQKNKDYYKYDEKSYTRNSVKMRIICPQHGEFWQKPELHKNGSGCKKCTASGGPGKYNEKLFQRQPDLKNKEAFVYLVEFTDVDDTMFYKIGITFNFKERMQSHNANLVKWFRKGSLYECFNLEQQIIKNYNHLQYAPQMELLSGGHTECFKKEIWNELITHNAT